MGVSEVWLQERQSITDVLIRHRAKIRISDGTTWYDHHCLFHDDSHRSASWAPETGTYYCRAEDKTYPVPEVLEASLIPRPGSVRRARARVASHPPIPAATIYTYLWPDGRPSHLKLRWGDGNQKQVLQSDLDLTFRLPEETYPLYGDYNLSDGLHLVVVEGEKCVERVTSLDDDLDGISILAITCGSAADLRNHATELAARLGQLAPVSITLWPDNDEPGLAAMRSVHLALNHLGLAHSTIKPGELGLPLKGDVCDFADQNHSLSALIAKQSGTLDVDAATALVNKTLVTQGFLVYPGSNKLRAINENTTRVIWKLAYGSLPNQKQMQEVMTGLFIKSADSPLVVAPRAYTNERVTWWRPDARGKAYKISAEGIDPYSDDPDGILLTAPDDGRHVDTGVDMTGNRSHLEQLLSPWQMTDTEVAMIEGWLVCAMGCLQTPILFMKSPAATGKTTLARFLLSVIEPMCPELEAKAIQDARHFALALMTSQVALIDNVSRMDSSVEDLLSRLVTGYTASVRPLYTDELVHMFLRRGIIITTTNWDIYKGDLASRTVVVEPQKREAGNADDRSMQRRFMPLIPKVRNYVMELLATYYREREKHPGNVHFRIGDLGVVFACLGYDTSALARQESLARSQVVAMEDPRIEAIKEMWENDDSDMVFFSTKEILDFWRTYGITEIWPEKSPRLSRWFAEKSPFFLDLGFSSERVMTNPRGYRFRRVTPTESRVDSADS